MDLNTEGCNVLLFELSSQMALDEGGLLEHVSDRSEEIGKCRSLGLSKQYFLPTAQNFGP